MTNRRNESKIISSIAFVLHCLLIALPMDILRYMQMRRKSVAGQVVVITGAGSGLGKRIAEIFALELNAKVAVLDINKETAQTVAVDIREKGGAAMAWACDVSDATSMKRTAVQVRECLGSINIVICNAAVLHFGHTLQLTDNQIQHAINVNIMGPINTIRAFLKEMETANSGQIVGISSIAGYFGETFGMAYCPTKFAMRGIMECLRMELRDRKLDGIVCTTVCPYFVRTPMILNKGMRPTCRLISFMSVERCSRRIIDAILKEKFVAFVPDWISIIPMVYGLMSVNMQKAGRDFLNCRYEPATMTDAPTIALEDCGICGRKISFQPKDCNVNEKSINNFNDNDLANDNDGIDEADEKSEANHKDYKLKKKGENVCRCTLNNIKENNVTTLLTINNREFCAQTNNKNDIPEREDSFERREAFAAQKYFDKAQFTSLYDMKDYFRVPAFHWLLTIPPALGILFFVWYFPEIFNHWQLGPLGRFLHTCGTEYSRAMLILNVIALVLHFGEAEWALYMANQLNFSHVCAMKWFIQTFIMGFPSLLILKAYHRRNMKSKSK